MVLVIVAWGDRVLQVSTVPPGGSFDLAELPGGVPGTDTAPGPLVTHDRGLPRLRVPRGANGSLRVDEGRPCSLDELRREGTARAAPPAVTEIPLDEGTTIKLELGPFNLVISHSRLDRSLLAPSSAPLDGKVARSSGGTAAALAGLLVCSAQVLIPLAELRGNDPVGIEAETIYSVDSELDDEAVPDAPAPPPELSANGEPAYGRRSHEPCGCGEFGRLGRPEPGGVGRYGVQGPADNPDPHLARAPGWWEEIFFPFIYHPPFVGDWGGDPNAPTAPWGRDDSLGTDAISARGHMWGDEIADAPGNDGLALDNDWGGLGKAIDPGPAPAAPPPEPAPPRIIHTGLRVSGPLPHSAVLQAAAERFERFRECYVAALERAPELGGRLEVQLEVAPSGAATHIAIARSELHDGALESCMATACEGLRFAHAGPDVSSVTYPLLLVPGTAASR
jgi:hypothetical protein